MSDRQSSNPGRGLISILIALAIGWAAWSAWNRPVLVTDTGNAADETGKLDWPDMRIEINSASAAELALLPGLGPQLAQRIVDDRAARGPFASIEELDRVPGIGRAIVERVKPYAVVDHR